VMDSTLGRLEGRTLQRESSTMVLPGADERVGAMCIHQKELLCLPSQFMGQSWGPAGFCSSKIPSEFSGIFSRWRDEPQSRNFCLCCNPARLCAGACNQSVTLNRGFFFLERIQVYSISKGFSLPFSWWWERKTTRLPRAGMAGSDLSGF